MNTAPKTARARSPRDLRASFPFQRFRTQIVSGLRGSAGVVALVAGTALAAAPPDLPVLGRIANKTAKEIASSPWSIGGETLDRDYAVYGHYRQYLGPLGAKAIRLQTGWAKCERQQGVYQFEWLDAVVDDALSQGVQPWLELNYGNPIYPGGGEIGLAGGLPSSEEALAAWDRWARALVMRYRDRVHQWEIWNEPDINRQGTATVEAYLALYARTARMIREVQPKSHIRALGLSGNMAYADRFLAGLKQAGQLDLVDAITFHGYPRNPDDVSQTDQLRGIIAKHGRAIEVRQGETGAGSQFQERFALSGISWTENLQAKWNLRRMLAHRAKDVPFNLFTMSDMHYQWDHRDQEEKLRMNHKGLLKTNPDQTISHAKVAYGAVRNVCTMFDDSLVRVEDFPFMSTALRALALNGYRGAGDGGMVVAYWFNDAPPAEANGVSRAKLSLPKARFQEPVVVDMLTGTVWALPAERWSQGADGAVFHDLPMYDAPMLIAERARVPLAAAGR